MQQAQMCVQRWAKQVRNKLSRALLIPFIMYISFLYSHLPTSDVHMQGEPLLTSNQGMQGRSMYAIAKSRPWMLFCHSADNKKRQCMQNHGEPEPASHHAR